MVIDGEKYYCCGTTELSFLLSRKGTASTCVSAREVLRKIHPELPNIQIAYDLVATIFGDGCYLETVTAELPDPVQARQSTLFNDEEGWELIHGAC